MAQEKTFIAVRWATLLKPNDERFVIINRDTREIVDDANGKGYKSPKAAHASFAHKRNYRSWKSSGISNNQQINVAINAQNKKAIWKD